MISKIIHLEWRNLSSNRWLQISFVLLAGLIFFAILNRSYHKESYQMKIDDVRKVQLMDLQNFIADHDSVTTGLKEMDNQRLNPIFLFSMEVRLVPQAVFEPTGLAPLSVGQSDIHAGIFPVWTFNDPFNKASVYYNPGTDLFGSFDFAFVLVFLIPLIVIAFSYNILFEERENGTLQMVISQPVSLMAFLGSRILFRFLILFLALLVLLLLSMLLAGVSVSGNITGLALLSGFSALYMMFWFGVSLLVNLFGKSSSFNITALLGVWVFFVLLIPTLLHLAVEKVHEIPSRSEVLVEMRNAEEAAFSLDRDEILDRYFMEHPEFIEAAEGSNADERLRELYEFYKWMYIVRLKIADTVSPIVDDYYGRLTEQQEFAGRISAFSPAVILKEAMNSLAGTSPAHYNHFNASTEQFRLEWMETIRNKMLREQFLTLEELDALPKLDYSSSDVNNGFGRVAIALSLHLLAVCGLIVLFRKKGRVVRFVRAPYHLTQKGLCLLFFTGILTSEILIAQDRPGLMVEATRISGQVTVDGRLDEPEWSLAPLISGFRQVEPNQGEPARYETEVRVLYNDEYIYIGAFNRDDVGKNPRVRDLRRNFDYFQNDLFGVVFDTFNNERDAISFQVTPYGNQRDLQVFDDFVFNRNFDVVWYAETVRSDSGWTVEMAIPWSSLRYEADQGEWGINFVRRHRRSNEESAWSPWPRAYSAYRTSYAGKLTNMDPPDPPLNVRVQPYSLVQGDRPYTDSSADISPKFGGEIKWSPSRSSVIDLTFNTDFAQADVDEQVINLTRFPIFFPEKRQFFLESANLFELGNLRSIKPFFSRRIGLTGGGEPVPIDAGFRYVDQTAERSVGGLLMRQRSSELSPASWFGVGRYQHNFGRNKRAGFMLTSRFDENENGSGITQNHVGNIDTFIRFTPRVLLSVNLSGSYDELEDRVGHSGDLWVAYRDNLIYAGLIQGVISSDYRARTGFVARNDIVLTSPAVNLNWRPDWRPGSVRAFTPGITVFLYHTYSDLTFEEGYVAFRPVGIEFQNGASLGYGILSEWQNLVNPFRPVGIEIEPGNYRYFQHELSFNSDRSAGVSIGGTIKYGGYFDGELTSINIGSALNPTPYFSAGLRVIHNRFRDLGVNSESRNVNLIAPNVRIALNPRIQLTAFWQHNTDINSNSVNTRFSWEFAPLSYIYLVFNDVHPFGADGLSPVQGNQQAIFKLTYLKQI